MTYWVMSVVYEAKGFIYEIKCYYLLHDILWDESQYYNIRIIGLNYEKPWHNYYKKSNMYEMKTQNYDILSYDIWD